jgi:hypothetical protein
LYSTHPAWSYSSCNRAKSASFEMITLGTAPEAPNPMSPNRNPRRPERHRSRWHGVR